MSPSIMSAKYAGWEGSGKQTTRHEPRDRKTESENLVRQRLLEDTQEETEENTKG